MQWREPRRLNLPSRPLRLTPQDRDFRRIVTQFVDALKSHDPTEKTLMQEEPSARIQSAVDEERRRGAAGQRGLITVFGGTGFLGRRIVLYLLDHGFQVRSASRHPERVASASRPDAGPADRAPFLPRFRALALFRRRRPSVSPPTSLPASKNLHRFRRFDLTEHQIG